MGVVGLFFSTYRDPNGYASRLIEVTEQSETRRQHRAGVSGEDERVGRRRGKIPRLRYSRGHRQGKYLILGIYITLTDGKKKADRGT
ncbi:MAG: hypothetical protein BSOLF_2429 [Candidatus Carbobacillus altaicus]|uniref:Uncharacterized protein n=1 Tax=Candidatus Carbonibacillus altaicus TaxID=2163959 RepID=A0A2R6XY55_9BACL|nr:MAG: hypothetical protein BSOLF_2429 [Candidatus Carbobacillus altaicus]